MNIEDVKNSIISFVLIGFVLFTFAMLGLVIWAIKTSPPEKPTQPSPDAVTKNINQDGYHCPCCRNNAPERK